MREDLEAGGGGIEGLGDGVGAGGVFFQSERTVGALSRVLARLDFLPAGGTGDQDSSSSVEGERREWGDGEEEEEEEEEGDEGEVEEEGEGREEGVGGVEGPPGVVVEDSAGGGGGRGKG